jgi:hypothetical protein
VHPIDSKHPQAFQAEQEPDQLVRVVLRTSAGVPWRISLGENIQNSRQLYGGRLCILARFRTLDHLPNFDTSTADEDNNYSSVFIEYAMNHHADECEKDFALSFRLIKCVVFIVKPA